MAKWWTLNKQTTSPILLQLSAKHQVHSHKHIQFPVVWAKTSKW